MKRKSEAKEGKEGETNEEKQNKTQKRVRFSEPENMSRESTVQQMPVIMEDGEEVTEEALESDDVLAKQAVEARNKRRGSRMRGEERFTRKSSGISKFEQDFDEETDFGLDLYSKREKMEGEEEATGEGSLKATEGSEYYVRGKVVEVEEFNLEEEREEEMINYQPDVSTQQKETVKQEKNGTLSNEN